MATKKTVAPGTRRRIKTETLTRIDAGNGLIIYTNTAGATVSVEFDKGDGVVHRVTLTT